MDVFYSIFKMTYQTPQNLTFGIGTNTFDFYIANEVTNHQYFDGIYKDKFHKAKSSDLSKYRKIHV